MAVGWVRMPRLARKRPPYGGWLGAYAAFGRETSPTSDSHLRCRSLGTFPGQTRHTHPANRHTGDVSGPNAAYAPGRPLYGGRFRAKRGIRTQRAVPDRTVLA